MNDSQRRHPELVTQHAIGALVGAAVGDALGAPFEFLGPSRYSAAHPAPRLGGIGEMTGGGSFGWHPGQFTDDTDMGVALAESLAAHRGLAPDDLWKRWRAWASGARDVGMLTRSALDHASHVGAAALAEQVSGGRSGGNGSLMRNFPVPLATMNASEESMVRLARAQSALTHHDPDAGTGCALHATFIRAAILGGDPLQAMHDAVRRLDDPARDRWSALLAPTWEPSDASLPNGTVWTCLAQAVWAFRGARGFEHAVVRAIELGGDADTVGCVTGSLAGAFWGIQSIPSRWTTYLHGTLLTPDGPREYRNADLQDLAVRLLGKSPKPPVYKDNPAGPQRVCDQFPVHAADWDGARSAPAHWAVVSACRTGSDFYGHPVRREVFLIDEYEEHGNHDALAALVDAVDSIDAFLAEDPSRPVVVHCHGGRSRTALILKAWAMRRYGLDEGAAHDWLTAKWSRAHRDNPVFLTILREEWPRHLERRIRAKGPITDR